MSMDQDWIGLRKSVLFYFCVVTSVLTSSNTSITNSSSFSTPSIMTTEQQTSTTVSLTTATTQAPVTTVPSDTPVNGSETSLGMDTMPSNSPSHAHSSATLLGFLVPVSATDQEPSGDAALQTNSTNVLGAQSSAFSVSNLLTPTPDSQVTMEQLQTVLKWLQQASANFIQKPNDGQCVTQHESISQTTRHDTPTSQNDTTNCSIVTLPQVFGGPRFWNVVGLAVWHFLSVQYWCTGSRVEDWTPARV